MINETPMVSVRGVHKFFGNLHVLGGIDLGITPGEVCVILGPSGSGKSTLLRCLNQLEGIDAGRVSVEGGLLGYREGARDQLYELPDKVIAPQRSCISMVFQRFNLFPHKTTLENVMKASVRVAKVEKTTTKARAFELLERVDLADRANHYPSKLSGSQQQRVVIVRALVMDPKVMLFDELTSALDPELVGEVLQMIRDLTASGMTMTIIIHEIGFVRGVASTVVFMDEGQVAEMGSPVQIIDNPQEERTREFFLKVLWPCRHHPSGLLFEGTIQVEERRTHFDELLAALTAQLDETALGECRDP